MKACSKRTEEKIKECIALEREEPMTTNEHYLADYKRTFMARYKTERHQGPQEPSRSSSSKVMASVLQQLRELGYHVNNELDLSRLLPPDPMDPAIDIMAECRAYYQGTRLLVGVTYLNIPKLPLSDLPTISQ